MEMVEQPIFNVKMWNHHPSETTTQKWMFQVPGISVDRGNATKNDPQGSKHELKKTFVV